jgi:hypothetical protein
LPGSLIVNESARTHCINAIRGRIDFTIDLFIAKEIEIGQNETAAELRQKEWTLIVWLTPVNFDSIRF